MDYLSLTGYSARCSLRAFVLLVAFLPIVTVSSVVTFVLMNSI